MWRGCSCKKSGWSLERFGHGAERVQDCNSAFGTDFDTAVSDFRQSSFCMAVCDGIFLCRIRPTAAFFDKKHLCTPWCTVFLLSRGTKPIQPDDMPKAYGGSRTRDQRGVEPHRKRRLSVSIALSKCFFGNTLWNVLAHRGDGIHTPKGALQAYFTTFAPLSSRKKSCELDKNKLFFIFLKSQSYSNQLFFCDSYIFSKPY